MKTKEKIKDTLLRLLEEHPADDVTVKMFCIESGLSKQTLYNHYYSLMDALDDAYRTDLEEGLRGCNTYHNWVEGFKKILELLFAKRKIYLHIYNSSRQEEFMAIIARHGRILVEKGIDDCASDKGMRVSEKDKHFMVRFYMNVFMGNIKDFFDSRMEIEPGYLADMCDVMMRHHIRHTLDNLQAFKAGTFRSCN